MLTAGADAVRRRDEARPAQVAARPKRALLGELGRIGANRRNGAGMRILDVDVERPGARIFEARNGVVSGRDAIDVDTADAVLILFEIGITEDADRARISLDLLDDEIVVLARLDVGPVFAKAGANCLSLGLVGLLERGDSRIGLTRRRQDQLAQRIARTRRRGRAIDADRNVGEAGVDVMTRPAARALSLLAELIPIDRPKSRTTGATVSAAK